MYLHMRFPEGKAKAVTLSYDDGVRQDLRLAELTAKRGIKCTFNINSALVEKEPGGVRLTWDEIRSGIIAKGHEVAVHGEYHLAPCASRTLVGLRDALNCRLRLEQELGTIIRGMAYPNSGVTRFTAGTDYETVRRYLEDIGIVYSRSLGGDNDSFLLPEDWYRWIPTAHHDNPKALDWAREFRDMDLSGMHVDYRNSRLFYLWGHSYEFDGNNNWDRIESICDILAESGAWFATNTEIYDYVTAFRSLVFSADGTLCYNPTLFDLYFETEKQTYRVRPGETCKIDQG